MNTRLLIFPILLAACQGAITSPEQTTSTAPSFAASGFDEFGYNRTARIFNGTFSSWCEERAAGPNCMGIYSPDNLVMKWNSEWDRGNDEEWAEPPYSAWLNNNSNGKVAGGSGAVWHYKIQWVGLCGADYTPLLDGGYCIWGIFEVLMDQGVDPNSGPGHLWFARANPNGYGN